MKFSVELVCGPGKLNCKALHCDIRTGPVCRLSFDECKEKFLQVGKAFEYNDETKHCQEVIYENAEYPDNIHHWQTCRVRPCDDQAENPCIRAKPSKLQHEF